MPAVVSRPPSQTRTPRAGLIKGAIILLFVGAGAFCAWSLRLGCSSGDVAEQSPESAKSGPPLAAVPPAHAARPPETENADQEKAIIASTTGPAALTPSDDMDLLASCSDISAMPDIEDPLGCVEKLIRLQRVLSDCELEFVARHGSLDSLSRLTRSELQDFSLSIDGRAFFLRRLCEPGADLVYSALCRRILRESSLSPTDAMIIIHDALRSDPSEDALNDVFAFAERVAPDQESYIDFQSAFHGIMELDLDPGLTAFLLSTAKQTRSPLAAQIAIQGVRTIARNGEAFAMQAIREIVEDSGASIWRDGDSPEFVDVLRVSAACGVAADCAPSQEAVDLLLGLTAHQSSAVRQMACESTGVLMERMAANSDLLERALVELEHCLNDESEVVAQSSLVAIMRCCSDWKEKFRELTQTHPSLRIQRSARALLDRDGGR